MKIDNVRYFGEDLQFHTGSVEVRDGMIAAVKEFECTPGYTLIPGLIDIHQHGNSGADFSDGIYDGLMRMARYHALHGVTSFAPASMTLPEEHLHTAYRTAVRLRDSLPGGHAVIRGIYMEGPFFSEKKKGAQSAAHLCLPDAEMVRRLNASADGMIRIVCVAPELEGALAFIREIAPSIRVSVGHTNADYAEAAEGFRAGATQVTHLFNAMPPMLHRSPGVIGAAAESDTVVAELICDGIHVHESVVRAAFKLFPGRICLISDSMAACGMPDGQYELGGQTVIAEGNRALLSDGTLAGSATPLYTCMQNAIRYGISPEQAVCAAAYTPARLIGADALVGSIAAGKYADLVLCDGHWDIQDVLIGGKSVF